MEQQTVCADCGGTGWRVVERDGLSGAERCDCVLRARAGRLLESSNIPPHYQKASFDNFDTRPELPTAQNPLHWAKDFAQRYAESGALVVEKPGLLFMGGPGTGKTHLAVAVIKRLMARGFECVFFDYQNLLERIKSSYDPAVGTAPREAYRRALECEVLLLDDLGAHRVTDWVEDTITSIITHRCNHDRAIIATTNLLDPGAEDPPLLSGTASDLKSRYYLAERIGFRARSRLFEMCTLISTRGVEDYRKRKGKRSL
jgi:DNA replication protein DnaC